MAWRRFSKARRAGVAFLGSPAQVKRAGSWRARAKEKVTGQGKGPFFSTAARLSVACSGVCPPERKTTPASSFGTWFLRTSAVAAPISSGVEGVLNCLPARTMLTFRTQAGRLTLAFLSSSNRQSRI